MAKKELYWNLDVEACGFIAQVLAAWLHKKPSGSPPNLTYEEWVGQLEKAQKALEDYTDYFRGIGPVGPIWLRRAKEAIHWIADNLEHLWD